jgi:hypothetical protein
MKTLLGFICMTASVIFVIWETFHFGGNFIPQTKEELLCDIVAILLFITGFYLYNKK